MSVFRSKQFVKKKLTFIAANEEWKHLIELVSGGVSGFGPEEGAASGESWGQAASKLCKIGQWNFSPSHTWLAFSCPVNPVKQ